MGEIILEILEIAGIKNSNPQTFGELIPYITNITITIVSIGGVFSVIGNLFTVMLRWNKWVD